MVVSCDLPKDVAIEILSRLPVKSLIRFRCVCKSWCALTKDPIFITKHQKHQEADNKKNGRLLVYHHKEDTDNYVFSLFPDETLSSHSYQYQDLSLNRDAIVLGPCNGIFCLYNRCNAVALWNPATRHFRTLRSLPLSYVPPFMVFPHSVFGFGCDPKTSDYKVVWIRVFMHEDDDTEHDSYKQVGVYTLSNDSWRELNGNTLLPADDVGPNHCYSYANGLYYWVAIDKNNKRLIVSFDMTDEVFQVIPAPSLPEWESATTAFAIYKESVAWILYDHHKEKSYYSIWVLEDECWTKQVTIGPLLRVERPIGFWKDGRLLIQNWKSCELALWDPITAETTYLGVEVSQAFIYCESLVSVEGGGTEYGKQDDSSNDHPAVPDFFDVSDIVLKDFVNAINLHLGQSFISSS